MTDVGKILDLMLADLRPGWERRILNRADMAEAAGDAARWLTNHGVGNQVSVHVADLSSSVNMVMRVMLIGEGRNEASAELIMPGDGGRAEWFGQA